MEVYRSEGNSVCSVPEQVEKGKESEVSYEVDSQENERVWKLIESNEDELESIGILCAVCVNELKEEKSLKGHMKWHHKILEPR